MTKDVTLYARGWSGRGGRLAAAIGMAFALLTLQPAASLAQADISGVYNMSGTALDGAAYTGSVVLAQVGPVYTVNWQTSAGPYTGVGVLQGSSLAVGWGSDTCTVVGYQIQSDGSLLGTWTDLTSLGQGTEANSPVAPGPTLAGSYAIAGTNPDSSPYTGLLTVTPHGPVYQFQWQAGESNFDGIGIQQGMSIAAGYDQSMQGKACGVALFGLNSDGTLTAIWGMYGQNAQGHETWAKAV